MIQYQLKQWWASPSPQLQTYPNFKNHQRFDLFSFPKKPIRFICVLEDFSEIIHNKVLIAAGVSAAIGQLSKPFTSLVLYKKDLNFKSIFEAGGFPSTHSSSVVAAATTLALERGFDDSVFGVTVIYACVIMYDAQGVRREVGNHARVLNKLSSRDPPLKESIGHSEVEVIAGGLFGFFVSLAVYYLL